MSRAQAFLASVFNANSARAAGQPNAKGLVGVRVLTYIEAAQLELALHEDAHDYIYNAAISIGEGIAGVGSQRYSWAAVKCYYSVFYALRAYLASSGIALFYIGTSPCSVCAMHGYSAKREKGNTHQVVLDLFRRSFPRSVLLSQTIDLVDPLDWVMARREEANYTISRFCDPSCPPHYRGADGQMLRRLLSNYVSDSRHLFTFDADHAMLAYPLRCITESVSVLKQRLHSSQLESRHVGKIFSDRQGRLTEVLAALNLTK